jgi:VanZ family protein
MEQQKGVNHPNKLILVIGVAVTVLTWLLGATLSDSISANKIALYTVAISWILWAVACLKYLLLSDFSLVILRPIIVLCCILLIGLTLDNATIKYLLYPINFLIDWLADFLGNYRRHVPSAGKIGHVVVFCALTLHLIKIHELIYASIFGIVCFVALVALATEGLQLFIPTRTTALQDLVFDGTGIVLALFFVLLVKIRLAFNHENQS